ncbi:GNAT family N-acetyltransferase [Mesorhizobium sp. CAU 1732]|uniref:GNAT family N-acetyltransferase n=1 Tax=Mesorhizobium sp. CAU 1732 TaxID=3140358 RepID=UPI0032609F1B
MTGSAKRSVSIRALSLTDLDAYRALRLTALRSNPDAFGASEQEDALMSDAEMARRVVPETPELSLGAFASDTLVGMAAYVPNPRLKMRHKAMMVAVFVAPEMRGARVGRALVEAIIAHARMQRVILQCTVAAHNEAARMLYHALGFEPYGLEKNALQVDGHFIDEELLAIDLR